MTGALRTGLLHDVEERGSLAGRLVLHVLLGAIVASGCDFRQLWRELASLSVAVLLIAPAVALSARRPRNSIALAALASLLSIREGAAFQVLAGTWLVLGSGVNILARRQPQVRGLRRLAWASGHAALPFLAGVGAVGGRVGNSALLLTIALLGVHVGAWPLLGPSARSTPEPPPGSREWTSAAVREGAATTMTILGLACLAVWLSTYGAGASGLVLAAPGGLALLWLGAGWTLDAGDRRRQQRWRKQAALAWCSILVAVGAATYL